MKRKLAIDMSIIFALIIVNLCNAHQQAFKEDIDEQYTVSCVALAFCRDAYQDAFSLP